MKMELNKKGKFALLSAILTGKFDTDKIQGFEQAILDNNEFAEWLMRSAVIEDEKQDEQKK